MADFRAGCGIFEKTLKKWYICLSVKNKKAINFFNFFIDGRISGEIFILLYYYKQRLFPLAILVARASVRAATVSKIAATISKIAASAIITITYSSRVKAITCK